jgi:hypothetical protein
MDLQDSLQKPDWQVAVPQHSVESVQRFWPLRPPTSLQQMPALEQRTFMQQSAFDRYVQLRPPQDS